MLFKPNATPEEVARWCDEQFSKAHTARQTLERQWLLNLSFFYGKQWVVWGPQINSTARLTEPKAPAWRVRLTVNKIQPYIRREMARLSSQKPRGFVMPASSDEEDRSAARAAEELAFYLHESLKIDEALDLSDWWTSVTGTSFLKVRFTEEIDPSTDQPGRLRVDVIRPFDIYVPNLEETRIEEQEWVAHVQSMPISKIKEQFGVDVAPGDVGISEVDAKIRNVMSVFNDAKSDSAIVKEFWIKPCKRYPKGLVVATANGKLLPYEEPEAMPDVDDAVELLEPEIKKPKGTIDWPFKHGRLPFIKRGHTLSGRFFDTTFVDQIISVQREYNRSRSQIIENKNLTSRPQWVVPIGAVDRNELTTEPGAVIRYTPGFNPPTPVQPPQLPNYVMQHIEVTGNEMDEIASQNEVSKGSVPPGVEAATAISFLQERDDSALTYAIRSKERAVQEMTQQLLALVCEFWDVGRMIRITGQNNVFDTRVLKGSDLRDNINYVVVTGSGTPISRAAQHAEIMEMVKSGMLPATKGLRFLNMPDVAAVIDELERDVQQAARENLMMSKGQPAVVEVWHDHIQHLDEHDNYKKREEYDHLPQEIKDQFRFHDFQHLTQLALLFNMPIPPENPQITMMKQAPPEMGGNPFVVDPMVEFALRQILVQLKAGGGAPPPAPPPGQ